MNQARTKILKFNDYQIQLLQTAHLGANKLKQKSQISLPQLAQLSLRTRVYMQV